VAIRVKKNPVFCLVAAAFGSFHEVVIVPPGLWGDLLVADWTETVLFLPQIKQLSFSCKGCVHLSTCKKTTSAFRQQDYEHVDRWCNSKDENVYGIANANHQNLD
jgi:hypothetical protein